MHQLVVGSAQVRVSGILAKPRRVDEGLGMLDAEADGERLGLHEHTSFMQHAEGVPSAVSQRHHHMMTVEAFAVIECHAGYPAVLDQYVGDATGETHFSTELPDLLTHGGNHAR